MVTHKVSEAIPVSNKFFHVQNSTLGWGQCELPMIRPSGNRI